MPTQGKDIHRGGCWPDDVGIVALEIYFPSQYVDQTELELYDGVSAGKYTIGLGQNKMGVCSDREDINSLCLTVVERLMEKHHIGYENIGRLEVGTETLLDKSKSVKTVLMQLFEESGNRDVEGIDTTNACYGGTAALLNALAWVESSAWDGRYALVVCGDIAVYASGSARPTGGAGAVAMLVGPNAPLVIERGTRSSYMRHAYDFYKPDMESEYPRVDGKLSIQCYLGALDHCYQGFCRKSEAKAAAEGRKEKVTLDSFDALLFHSPYCKLVQKSMARLVFNDLMRTPESEVPVRFPSLKDFRKLRMEETYDNRDLEKALVTFALPTFEAKTQPSLLLANQIGNMYTASLYGSLIAFLISKPASALAGNRLALFSYGSGLAATLYAIRVSSDSGPGSPLARMCQSLADVRRRLDARTKITPQEFSNVMKYKEEVLHRAPYTSTAPISILFAGTWYLTRVDEQHRRTYECTPHDSMNGSTYVHTSVSLTKGNKVGVGIQATPRLVAHSS